MTIRAKLFSTLFLLAIALAALAFEAFYALSEQSMLTRSLVADRVVPMEQLKKIGDSYAVSVVDTVHKARAGSMAPEDAERSVEAALATINTEWRNYRSSYLTPDELRLAEEFDRQRLQADQKLKAIVTALRSRNMQTLANFADTQLYPTVEPLGEQIDGLMKLQLSVAREMLVTSEKVQSDMNWLIGIVVVASLCLLGVSAWIVQKGVVQPIDFITSAMTSLAAGQLDTKVFGEGRRDEIGTMASAVAVFRDGAKDRVRLEAEAEQSRASSEDERRQREAERARQAYEVRHAMQHLTKGLQELAAGNLIYRLDEPFATHLDLLRENYNQSVAKLDATLQTVSLNAQTIAAGSAQIMAAANDLSKRTEQQAASVEETAAALEQITITVKDSSRRAEEAGRLVAQTKSNAEKSGGIVREAIAAMGEIERSSDEIVSIIGVIDDIAFQTNLLALNAGVEAARAGDAGKGFAVVAQEVRELAQRSATAAKEIKALIRKSGEQVRAGVALVDRSGNVLEEIVGQVQEVNSNVLAIVDAAREQSTGLSEINTAVNTMDQGTQQNAAMVEESTAASNSLAREADALFNLIAQFQVSKGRGKAQEDQHHQNSASRQFSRLAG